MGHVAQRVLVAGFAQGAGVGFLDRVAGKTGENLAPGGTRILGEDIGVAQARARQRNMQLLQWPYPGSDDPSTATP